MILDAFALFTGGSGGVGNNDGATDSPTTGTQNSSNVLDLHMAGIPVLANLQGARDMGIGDKPALKLLVQVTVAFASGTSLQIAIAGAPDNGSGAAGSFTNWWLSPAVAEASLVVGARLYDMDFPRPPAGVGIPRFVRLAYITVGTHTAGKLEGAVVLDRSDQIYQGINNAIMGGYPAGITIAN
jgi:hypothetical protein